MTVYRKKPVEVEAMQFRPFDEDWYWSDLTEFFGSESGEGVWQSLGLYVHIHTIEGTMRADHSDWIIKGVEGEFYPCRDSIFRRTYERVD